LQAFDRLATALILANSQVQVLNFGFSSGPLEIAGCNRKTEKIAAPLSWLAMTIKHGVIARHEAISIFDVIANEVK
jgi:hypothetical protein